MCTVIPSSLIGVNELCPKLSRSSTFRQFARIIIITAVSFEQCKYLPSEVNLADLSETNSITTVQHNSSFTITQWIHQYLYFVHHYDWCRVFGLRVSHSAAFQPEISWFQWNCLWSVDLICSVQVNLRCALVNNNMLIHTVDHLQNLLILGIHRDTQGYREQRARESNKEETNHTSFLAPSDFIQRSSAGEQKEDLCYGLQSFVR